MMNLIRQKDIWNQKTCQSSSLIARLAASKDRAAATTVVTFWVQAAFHTTNCTIKEQAHAFAPCVSWGGVVRTADIIVHDINCR
jgi:hypothetical protein